MGIEQNKAIVKAVWEEILNKGNFDSLYNLISKDYTYHAPGNHDVKGPDNLKQFVIKIRQNVPDLPFEIENLIVEGNKIASHCIMSGTLKATGQLFKTDDILISRIGDGKVIEDWEVWDRLTMVQQGAKGWFQKRMIDGIVRKIDKGMGFVE